MKVKSKPRLITKKPVLTILMLFALFVATTYCQSQLDIGIIVNNFNDALIKKKEHNKKFAIDSDRILDGKYVGQIKTNNKNIYLVNNILHYDHQFNDGLGHIECKIYVYDNHFNLIGYYIVNEEDLPIKATNNYIYFRPDYCNHLIKVKIKKTFPHHFELICHGETQNILEFQGDKKK